MVIIADESRYCISNADGRTRIWKRQGERYADNCMMEINQWGGPSIMVWSVNDFNHTLGPVVFQNIGPGRGYGVNAARYTDRILRPLVVQHFARYRNNTFQHDHSRRHTARATRDFVQQNNITIMPWPALNPDSIEHLWDEIQRKLKDVHPKPTPAVEL